MKKVCVFLGSNPGHNPVYLQAARALGEELVKRDLTLVYGGASIGLMGELAQTVLNAGGHVIGIMPEFLIPTEAAHQDLMTFYKVKTMSERKTMLVDISDAFITLPGGLGTLEEITEVWNSARLKQILKPCGFLNTNGYYQKFFDFMHHTANEGFLDPDWMSQLHVEASPAVLLDQLMQASCTVS